MKLKLKFPWYLILLLGAWSSNYSQDNPRTYYFQKLKNEPEANLLLQNSEYGLLNFLSGFIFNKSQLVNDKHLKIDSIMAYGTFGGKSTITVTYDSLSRFNSFLISHFFNNHWENSTLVAYEYDLLGNRTYAIHKYWTGSNWRNDITEYFYYDSLGNNILHLTKIWYNNSWINLRNVSNIFDPDGNIIESINKEWVSGQWINSSKLIWEYFPTGIMAFFHFQDWENDHWVNKFHTNFKYDLDWVLVSAIAESWNGHNWENYLQMLYKYNLDEPQKIGLLQIWNNNQWIDNERFSYSFNEFDYFTHGYYEFFVNNSWIPGDGPILISNPDGFDLGFITNELVVYYDTPTDVKDEKLVPDNFKLSQNYPNPFNPTTKIKYTIHSNVISTGGRILGDFSSSSSPRNDKVNVKLKVYDILGNEIAALVNEQKPPGTYEIEFDASSLPSGVYFYKLTAGKFSEIKKMILLK